MPKIKTPFEMPAIDHQRQRFKIANMMDVDVSGSNFKPAKGLIAPGLYGKVPKTMSFAPGQPLDGSPGGEETEEAKAVIIMSKKASSTTRKKIVAARSSRDTVLATNLAQSMDVTAAEAQIEKLKSIVMAKSTAQE